MQVGFPLLLNEIWHGEHRQAAFNFHFRHNVLAVVGLKQRPFFGVVMRIISGSAAVCLCWLTGGAEIADQSLAGSQLLFVLRNAQRPACRVQTRGDNRHTGRAASCHATVKAGAVRPCTYCRQYHSKAAL